MKPPTRQDILIWNVGAAFFKHIYANPNIRTFSSQDLYNACEGEGLVGFAPLLSNMLIFLRQCGYIAKTDECVNITRNGRGRTLSVWRKLPRQGDNQLGGD